MCVFQKKKDVKINISLKIIALLSKTESLTSQEINQKLNANEKDILIHLRTLISEDKIKINHQNKYQLK